MLSREQSRAEDFERFLKKAEEAFNAVLEHRPSPSAYNGLGSVYLLRGDIDRSEKEIHSALELEPDYEPAKQDLQQIEDLRKEKKQPSATRVGLTLEQLELLALRSFRGCCRSIFFRESWLN